MTERERLIELLKAADEDSARRCITDYNEAIADNADYLLSNGVIVPPCKVGDYVRFKGLTSLWRVDAIHYYREGLPQISVTNGKITTTVTDDGMLEVLSYILPDDLANAVILAIDRLNSVLGEEENKIYAKDVQR